LREEAPSLNSSDASATSVVDTTSSSSTTATTTSTTTSSTTATANNADAPIDLASAMLLSPRSAVDSKFAHLQLSISGKATQRGSGNVAAVIADAAATRFSAPRALNPALIMAQTLDDDDRLAADVDAKGLCEAMLAGRFGALQHHFAALDSDDERQRQTDAMQRLMADLRQVCCSWHIWITPHNHDKLVSF
jgi:hypothetical protein